VPGLIPVRHAARRLPGAPLVNPPQVLEIRFDAVGSRAPTDSDILAWLRSAECCFNGDLVFDGGTSMLLRGSVTGCLAALDRPDQLDGGEDRLTDAG
jgi:hypothetical protein